MNWLLHTPFWRPLVESILSWIITIHGLASRRSIVLPIICKWINQLVEVVHYQLSRLHYSIRWLIFLASTNLPEFVDHVSPKWRMKKKMETWSSSMPRNPQCSWDHAPHLQKIISINTFFKCNDVLSPAGPQKWNSSLRAKQVVEALKRNF